MRTVGHCAFGVGVVTLVIPSISHAGYVRGFASGTASVSSVLYNGTDSGGPAPLMTFNPGYLPPASTITKSDIASSSNLAGSTAMVQYSLAASVGTLRASVNANGNAAADFVENPDLFNVAGGTVLATAEWGDEMIVTGTPGQPVKIVARVVIHASGGFTQGTTADTNNFFQFKYQLPQMTTETVDVDDLLTAYSFDQTFMLNLNPGQYNVSNFIHVQANAVGRINDPNPDWKDSAMSEIDASNTASIYFDVISGGDYHMASGADLRSVPAPHGVATFACAAIVSHRRPRRTGRC